MRRSGRGFQPIFAVDCYLAHHLARAGVDGEDDGDLSGDFTQSLQDPAQLCGIIYIRRAVQGDDRIRLPHQ